MNLNTTQPSPAEIYDTKFVPALFGPWGRKVAGLAEMSAGMNVLDVACGTGALALAARDAVGAGGTVTGLDANPEMLAVARGKAGDIEWIEGAAEALPFGDNSFDAVASQFGFMFFTDRAAALREMMRVLRPGGRMAVAVCGAVEISGAYAEFARLLDRVFGVEAGNAFRAPFVLGDPSAMAEIAREAGLAEARIEQHLGEARFDSIAELVFTEQACVWTLGGVLSDAQFQTLLAESETALAPWLQADGSIRFDMPAVLLVADKPR